MDPEDRGDGRRPRQLLQGQSELPSWYLVILQLNSNKPNPQGAEIFGLNVDKDNNITYREWAPNATQASLVGDFSMSNTQADTYYKFEFSY